MTDRPERTIEPAGEQLLDELAKQDEVETADGPSPDSEADSALKVLKAELDTLASQLREPAPVVPFEDESDCRRVTELVEALGLEPSLAGQAHLDPALPDSEPLGELGQYQLLAELGEGGMGTVYKALHTRLDKIVAVKVLPEQKTSDSHAVARFEREMRAVGKLEHANIVRAMDANEHEQTHYLVMEYVDGADLSELVHQVGPLPIADACELVRQAAHGLQHAHEHNLVHRDIKPSNLMVTKQGQLKILDLGLARLHNGHHGELTSTGQVMGTIDFMAPEQTGDSHDVDIRADIYGLGSTLFSLLCGRAPYADKRLNTTIKKLNAMATRPVPSVLEHREEVPEELAAIIMKMIAKDADQRYTTPGEVADALEPFSQGSDLSALVASWEQPGRDDGSPDVSVASTELYLTDAMTETKSTKVDEPDPESFEASVDQEPDVSKTIATAAAQTQSSGAGRITKIVATLAGMAALFAAVTVIVIQTNKGNIKVVSNDPDIEVTIKRNGEAIDGFQVKQRDGGTSYFSGDFEIELTGAKSDSISITNREFKLTRGKTVLVEIIREAKLAAKPTPPIAKAPFDAAEARQYQKTWAEHLGIPSELEIELPTNQKLTLVLIPPGEFLMGSTDEEQTRLLAEAQGDRAANRSIPTEGPSRQVQITQPFYLGKYEVTKAQWQAAMGGDPATLMGDKSHPVDDMNWDEIPPFLAKLNEGASVAEMQFAVPTEEQWEYACRAGTTTLWHFDDSHQTLDEYAWFLNNSAGRTHPVGQLRPNGLGLYDMHGNAWEWCTSSSAVDDQATAEDDPTDTRTDSLYVRRGGSWNCPARNARTAFRHPASPSNRDLGFRVALPISGRLIERLKHELRARPRQLAAPQQWQPGPADDVLPGIVARPTKLPGIRRWQVETVAPRDGIESLAISPSGNLLACTSTDRQVRVYDLKTGKLQRLFVGHPREVRSVAWHPGGRWLATGSRGGVIRLWDMKSNEPQEKLTAQTQDIFALAFSPDGRFLASGSEDGTVVLWDFDKRTKQRELANHGVPVWRVAWSPDGKRVASIGHDKVIQIHDVTTGESVSIGQAEQPTWPVNATPLIAWSPDGKQIAMGGAGEFTIFNAVDGKLALKGGKAFPIVPALLAWVGGGNQIAVNGDANCQVRLFSTVDGEPTSSASASVRQHAHLMALSPGVDRLATAGSNNLNVHSFPDMKPLHTLHNGFAQHQSLAVSGDGGTVVTGSGVRLWNANDGSVDRVLSDGGLFAVDWSPDGRRLAIGDYKRLLVMNLTGGQTVTKPSSGTVAAVAWSPGGRRLAAHIGREIHIWDDVSNAKPSIVLSGHDSEVSDLAWSPDGTTIAVVSHSSARGQAWCWNAETGKLNWTHAEPETGTNWLSSLDYTTDGTRLLLRGAVSRYVDAQTGTAEPYLKEVPRGQSLSISRDGSRFVAGGYYNGLTLHDSRSGHLLRRFSGHAHGSRTVARFLPDGRRIASVNAGDHTLRMWDADTGRLLWLSLSLPDGKAAVFSEAGQLQKHDPEVEDHLVYIIEYDDGRRELLKPSEFRRRIASRSIASAANADRRVALWVLAKGGGVKVSGQEHDNQHMYKAEQLPEQSFELNEVTFHEVLDVVDEDLVQLTELSHLKRLDFGNFPISDAGMQHISQLSSLESLELPYSRVTDEGIALLKDLPKLRVVRVGGIDTNNRTEGLGDGAARALSEMKQLQEVDLICCQLTDKGLEHLSQLSGLIRLQVSHTDITDAGFEHISRLRELSNLDLTSVEVTDNAMPHIGKLQNLTHLNLSACVQITNTGIAHLHELTHLQYLNLSDTQLTDAGMVHLESMKNLSILSLTGTAIADGGLAHLARLPNLRVLYISLCHFTDAGLAHISRLTSLSVLHLDANRITDTGLEQLYQLSNLELVSLTETDVSAAGVGKLQKVLPDCKIEWDAP